MQIDYLNENIARLRINVNLDSSLSYGYVEKLREAVVKLNANPKLKVVVLEGGQKYFSSGADELTLKSIVKRGDPLVKFTTYVAEIPRLITLINVPTIAAMAGHALGGGLAIGLWCDIAILSEECLYGSNFIKLGFTPGMGSTAILPHIFGNFLGREMLFSGRLFKGKEIKLANCALNNYILPQGKVLARSYELADEISNISEEAIKLLKSSMAEHKKKLLEPILESELAMHKSLSPVNANEYDR